MLDPDKALEQIAAQKRSPETETCPVEKALQRVLVSEVSSPLELPPFDKAAMDGFAVQLTDESKSFRIVETIAAGETPRKTIKTGECSRIMTGAMMPDGAEKVIRVEYTEERDGLMHVVEPEPYANVIKRGENLKKGQVVLTPRVLGPQDIGVLCALGYAEAVVARTPLVGIITTGSELKEPGEKLEPGQIYNSNGQQLCAQVQSTGCGYKYFGIVPDDPPRLGEAVERGLAECDLLLLSGGVSMGSFDFVPGMLEEKGVEILFHKVAIKPGKPTLFGRKGDRFVFGLPGNPVSTFVIFEVMVKVLLYGLMGLEWSPREAIGVLAEDYKRRETVRAEYLPATLEGDNVHLISYHGSSHLNALGKANGLIRVERGVDRLEKGTKLSVRFI